MVGGVSSPVNGKNGVKGLGHPLKEKTPPGSSGAMRGQNPQLALSPGTNWPLFLDRISLLCMISSFSFSSSSYPVLSWTGEWGEFTAWWLGGLLTQYGMTHSWANPWSGSARPSLLAPTPGMKPRGASVFGKLFSVLPRESSKSLIYSRPHENRPFPGGELRALGPWSGLEVAILLKVSTRTPLAWGVHGPLLGCRKAAMGSHVAESEDQALRTRLLTGTIRAAGRDRGAAPGGLCPPGWCSSCSYLWVDRRKVFVLFCSVPWLCKAGCKLGPLPPSSRVPFSWA